MWLECCRSVQRHTIELCVPCKENEASTSRRLVVRCDVVP